MMHGKKLILKKDWMTNFNRHGKKRYRTLPKRLIRIFKSEFIYREYFNNLERRDFLTLSKFRTSNHKLPIEYGRWNNFERGNRKCNFFNFWEIGDEFHYILNCKYFKEIRNLCITGTKTASYH